MSAFDVFSKIGDIVTGALPTVGGVASSLMGNSANLKNAREQRAHDLRMWQMQADYNKPVNQVARLREAGINPALSIGNVETGTMSNSAGGQTAPTADFSPIAQGIRDSVELYQQRRLQDAQIDKLNSETMNQSIKNKFENQRQILELQQMLENKDLTSAERRHIMVQIDGLFKQNQWIDKKNSAEIAKSQAETAQAHAQVSYLAVLEEGQRLVNEFAPKHQKAILSEIGAHINQMNAAANDSNEHAVYNIAMSALTEAQKKGVDIDSKTKERMASSLVSASMANATKAWAESDISRRAAKTGTWSTKFFGTQHDSNVKNHFNRGSGGVR